MFGNFTGFHRVFTEDEKYDKEDSQKFKDVYVGRIIFSTGKISHVSQSVEERPGFFHSFAQQGSLFHRLGWSITYSTQF
jgi:hypothetical protein